MSTVYLVDDDHAFRDSTAMLLEANEFDVHDFPSAADFILHTHQNGIEEDSVLVSDVRMPDKTGIELLAELFTLGITLPVVMITGHGDMSLAVKAMKNGAFHFLPKPVDQGLLVATLEEALNNPSAQLRSTDSSKDLIKKLSPREQQVLKLVCAGKLNKTIADILGISIKTVELHRSNLQGKLNTRSVQELVRLTLGFH